MSQRDKKIISYNMSRIRSSGSAIERSFGKLLWQRGFRYRKQYKKLLGKPDFVLVRYKIAIFCDSEFWHGYDWELRKKDFKVRQDFWIAKIESNIKRDIEVNSTLKKTGWKVFRFWGNEIKKNPEKCANKIERYIKIFYDNLY